MSDMPDKRPWYRIHLSTFAVLTLVCGLLIWANLREELHLFTRPGYCAAQAKSSIGWPRTIACEPIMLLTPEAFGSADFRPLPQTGWPSLAFNMACAVAILVSAALASEWFARRLKKRVHRSPRPRMRLRVHLSTAIVLMFVASGLLYLNVRPTSESAWSGEHGWPMIFCGETYSEYAPFPWLLFAKRLLLDGLVAVAILAAAGLLFEWLFSLSSTPHASRSPDRMAGRSV